jgi:MFS superfamily sulfate permease-like transporter
VPSDFIEKWTAFFQHFGGVNATALAIGAGSVLISVYWGKITRVLPGPMVAILLSTAGCAFPLAGVHHRGPFRSHPAHAAKSGAFTP